MISCFGWMRLQRGYQIGKHTFFTLLGTALVRFVLSIIPIYLLIAMNTPKWVIKETDKIRRGFIWKGRKLEAIVWFLGKQLQSLSLLGVLGSLTCSLRAAHCKHSGYGWKKLTQIDHGRV